MESPLELALYAAVKLLVYTLWCRVGLSWVGLSGGGLLPRALGLGALRWMLGLVVGVVIFFVFRLSAADQVLSRYVAVYVPVRVLEWGLLAHWLLPRGGRWPGRRRVAWVAAGILLSFLTDLTSPQMIREGRFCVGRCLC